MASLGPSIIFGRDPPSAKSKKNLIDLLDLDLICPDLVILTPLSNLSKIGTKVIKPCKYTKIVKEMSKYTK